uniref:hypothetical protein n=1 Tax=Bacillus multifaciens TaxID=3068506 RepID=UPI003F491190
MVVELMGKHYPIDRDGKGRYRHSFVFMRGTYVSVKLLGIDELVRGKVSTIEKYYIVLDVEDEGEINQVTINFSVIKFIKHDYFPTVEERSPKENISNPKTSFIFDVGEQIGCVFRDGKILKGELLSEDAYYIYIKTDRDSYITIMKGALNFIRHSKHDPQLLVDDFYIQEMKDNGYSKPTEFVFEVGNEITVVFENGKELPGIVSDESKYWLLLNMGDKQVTVFKGSYAYIKHEVFKNKATLYVENKKLRKQLRKQDK